MEQVIQQVMERLKKNNMEPYFVERKEEVTPLVASLLREGDTVAVGGSVTLTECEVLAHLRSGRYRFLDRYAPGLTQEAMQEIHRGAFGADAYLCSCNAVTLDGELYNVDGNGNRVGAIAYGPASVIVVVGKNKLVPDLAAAVQRVKSIAAPLNCKRLGNRTPCAETGRCISLDRGETAMTAGCASPGRVCCEYLVSGRQKIKDRIKVILVGEALGY